MTRISLWQSGDLCFQGGLEAALAPRGGRCEWFTGAPLSQSNRDRPATGPRGVTKGEAQSIARESFLSRPMQEAKPLCACPEKSVLQRRQSSA
jgi:hypothetical protein